MRTRGQYTEPSAVEGSEQAGRVRREVDSSEGARCRVQLKGASKQGVIAERWTQVSAPNPHLHCAPKARRPNNAGPQQKHPPVDYGILAYDFLVVEVLEQS